MKTLVYSASLTPRVAGLTPKLICENEVVIFDYVGPYVQSGMQVDLSTDFNGNTFTFTTSTSGPIKLTYFIETYIDGNGVPRYRQGIREGVHSQFNFSSSLGYYNDFQTNFGKSTISIKNVVYQSSSGNQNEPDASTPIRFGWSPNWSVENHNGQLNKEWLSKIFPSCMQGKVLLRSSGLSCVSENLGLSVVEVEYDQVDHLFQGVGLEYVLAGNLSSTEVSDFRGSSGLDIASLTSDASRSVNGNTVTFSPGKYYAVKIINTDHGRWQETIKFIQISEANWDLVLKDNTVDRGQEPIEVWDRDVFRSTYLWNRLNDVSQPAPSPYSEHEDLDYVNTPGNTNKMFFEVENIGCDASPAGETVRLYWTRARSNEQWDKDWIYDLTDHTAGGNAIVFNSILRPLGSEITIPNPQNGVYSKVSTPTNPDAFTLPGIAAGGNFIPSWAQGVDWFPPKNDWYEYSATSSLSWTQKDKRNIICLLAKVGEINSVRPSDDPIVWEGAPGSKYAFPNVPISEFVANNNNVNTRNTILVDDPNNFFVYNNGDWDHGYGTVLVPNRGNTTRNIDLCLDLLDADSLPTDFVNYGEIYIGVTDQLWASWISNGSPTLTNAVVAEPGLFLATSGTHVCINDLNVTSGSEEQVGVRFLYQDASVLPSTAEFYEYSLVEVDRSEDEIPGSASVFQVTVPTSNPSNVMNKKDDRPEPLVLKTGVDLTIYPNPTRDILIVGIQTEVDATYSIAITDINGRDMEGISGVSISRNFSRVVDVKAYGPGVYFVELTSAGKTQRKKVIVSH